MDNLSSRSRGVVWSVRIMKRRLRVLISVVAVVVVGSVVLSWPVANWLMEPACWVAAAQQMDAVYVMAGSPSEARVQGL